jgi:protein phosphatase
VIPIKNAFYPVSALTDPGSTGKNNEDRYAVQAFKINDDDPTPVLFAMVADGIGGKQAGEVAAEIATDTILAAVRASDGTDPIGTMRKAILETNDVIVERAAESMDNSGMGTTATCAWIIGNQLFAANVGNSRLYLMRDQKLKRISIDHSWVQEALEMGLLTPEQAKNHPNARIITRHLGASEIEPDFRIQLASEEGDAAMEKNQGVQLQPDDLILICSDGLSDLVEDEEIEQALLDKSMAEAIQSLTDLANDRGGPDNITTVTVRIPETKSSYTAHTIPMQLSADKEEPKDKTGRKPAAQFAVYILSIVVLVALVLLSWMFLPLFIP